MEIESSCYSCDLSKRRSDVIRMLKRELYKFPRTPVYTRHIACAAAVQLQRVKNERIVLIYGREKIIRHCVACVIEDGYGRSTSVDYFLNGFGETLVDGFADEFVRQCKWYWHMDPQEMVERMFQFAPWPGSKKRQIDLALSVL